MRLRLAMSSNISFSRACKSALSGNVVRERSDLRPESCCLYSRIVLSAVVRSCDSRITRPFVARC